MVSPMVAHSHAPHQDLAPQPAQACLAPLMCSQPYRHGTLISVLFSTFLAAPPKAGADSPGQWARANNVEPAAWPKIFSPGHCRAFAPCKNRLPIAQVQAKRNSCPSVKVMFLLQTRLGRSNCSHVCPSRISMPSSSTPEATLPGRGQTIATDPILLHSLL